MSQQFIDPSQQRPRPLTPQERERIWAYRDKYYYSPRYSDDNYEYRHVVLPRELLKLIPRDYFTENGTFKLLTEDEWRGQLGITQSLGWVHYGCHAPEPHILLFRRPKKN
ncbi:Cyclin-dependent kinases regulatory subunit (Cell division control protein cks1) [Brettanomyces bruxellensis]|uniref:Cyclin-dependent kinases regulatory subunit n=1 Tax=Dekkera bruxellensis TaxID=5007 RepID=A0A3F2Y5T1_DEKBR|nr:Cyclin-dependent kinases regulatory subunit (Cell division control protein cks1) [Brettanomyces bruxellensis]VUG19630.1 suc1 [Brettanomyces bruxellensis]